MMEPKIIANLLDRCARDEVDGPRSQALRDAIAYIELAEKEKVKLMAEIEELHGRLNLETAKRFAADNPPNSAVPGIPTPFTF
ncbi:MAG TPA: hypothetical protein VNZ47_11930 [Candidatus Dormibacteraeota bacterium]|jgi:hypothetical protein|nr:hypothetical protein [Candidatus Dormibacteraeota bacterium]